ncbi:hypothetical protein ACFWA9_23865 [Kitasatospora sp. NPDC059973]|uniref:hypothetical protein n=1 Tax=Kitasatospora sp. NPDC059973 TaxID=3347020 RepID=UPI0036B8FE3F
MARIDISPRDSVTDIGLWQGQVSVTPYTPYGFCQPANIMSRSFQLPGRTLPGYFRAVCSWPS